MLSAEQIARMSRLLDLERAYRQHDADLQWIKNDTWLRGLRGDARYRALLASMNLSAEPRADSR
jgi:hypothetical protein